MKAADSELEGNNLDERSSGWMYSALASIDADPRRRRMLERLSEFEERHAAAWADALAAAGRRPRPFRAFPEHRLVVAIARVFGVGAVLPLLHKWEVEGIAKYREQAGRLGGLRAAFEAILADELVHEIEIFAELRRPQERRGELRSAILGANDGLGSILALAAGVAGGTDSSAQVLIAGVSGLVAGAFSMAASNWVSTKAEREVLESKLGLERDAAALAPELKRRQLAEAWTTKGEPEASARERAARLEGDELAAAVLAESGVNAAELEEPSRLALTTGASFLAAGAVPLVPFLFLDAGRGALASTALTAAALFAAGLLRALSTLKPFGRSALEMTAVGMVSAAVTWAVGRAIGAAL